MKSFVKILLFVALNFIVNNSFAKSLIGESCVQDCDISGSKIDEGEYKNFSFAYSDQEDLTFTNVIFEKSKFNNATFENLKIINSEFLKSSFDVSDISGAEFIDSKFTKSTFSYSDLSESTFLNSDFTDTKMNNSDISEVSMDNVILDEGS